MKKYTPIMRKTFFKTLNKNYKKFFKKKEAKTWYFANTCQLKKYIYFFQLNAIILIKRIRSSRNFLFRDFKENIFRQNNLLI